MPLFAGLFRTSNPTLCKAALGILGLPGGPVRLPLVPATDEELSVLQLDLRSAGVPGSAA
jgi:4-hydroxy-tetrahydrodipicolinate synthase